MSQKREKSHLGVFSESASNVIFELKSTSEISKEQKSFPGRYPCPMCSYTADYLSRLKRHLVTHTGSFYEQMNSSFIQLHSASDLPANFLTQDKKSGSFFYKCPMCSYTAAFYSILKRHIVTHTGEHPHKCSICHTSFTRKENLKRHMVSLHKTVCL
ncbi:transcriptional repressor CTCF-like isoform X2 [Stegodyphus dumicola]|uniref:transcriptional repressor CTCF-like isoform X2 n=1 Tax=Stegodyphus dumicola TaxID=202533 RepID=UPI0015B2E1CA|nr:transcriptional repressor CTCF-like isoform X2 [Stegodyphus dumicola]